MRPVKAIAQPEDGVRVPSTDLDDVYEQHVDFVWRNLRRLGVPAPQLEDACQDVFLVVHRRRGDFAGRSSVRTWLFGIALRVASDYRRKLRRSGAFDELVADEVRGADPGPFELASRHQAVEILERFLDALSEANRPVFILAELEGMTAPEIAQALSLNVNTVYSRLRLGRQAFERAVERWSAGRKSNE
jgi:RNA polymerase sigma-70 factor, ECF subfamily